MKRAALSPSRQRQRGWAGLIGLLIALLIVAWLGKILLARLLPAESSQHAAAGTHVPGGAAPAPLDPTTAAPSPRTELERARNMGTELKAQAADEEKRIDAQTQ
ncbi:MAG: hypothetical protein JSR18_13435 [Proteobacteria bacterium]|nr:hypothetical protein [Pseudomonadota bacterium]